MTIEKETFLAAFLRRFRRAFRIPMPGARRFQMALRGRRGIEVGGPSRIFKRDIPIYKVVASLDGVNFSADTVWGRREEGQGCYDYLPGRSGSLFIREATDLRGVADGGYDFVLSCNNLEHVANPLKALREWLRVLRPDGAILLILPNKRSNFDHRRAVTSFEHLLDDLRRDTDERDLTHLDEILRDHDLSMDTASGSLAAFKERSLRNFENRCLHHHVFDMPLIEKICTHVGLTIALRVSTRTDFIVLATRR